MVLDIGCANKGKNVNPTIVNQISEELTVPFSVGGGIRDLDAVSNLISSGAEKVVINSAGISNPKLIEKAALRYGQQCIVVSIDASLNDRESYEVLIENGRTRTGLRPEIWAKEAESLGAGEILINSVDHDGMMNGYDIKLINLISTAVNLPVIAAGGAGKPSDCAEAVLKGGASAVAVGSLFHFRQITPNAIKQKMSNAGIPVRLN